MIGAVFVLSINTLVIYLENIMEDRKYYYNRVTGNIFELDMKYVALADKYLAGDRLLEYADWERDAVLETVKFINDFSDYIDLPSKYEVDELRLMARFCCTRTKKKVINKLTDALMGKEPKTKFNKAIRKLNIINEWYEYKLNEHTSISVAWCEKNDIEYTY